MNRSNHHVDWVLLIFWGIVILAGSVLLIWSFFFFPAASIVIEWSTASEVDTAGYNIYRAESPDGDKVKVNEALILASGDPFTGGEYQYTDTEVDPKRTYYYTLEDVEYNGNLTHHGPIEATSRSNEVYRYIFLGIGMMMLLLGGIGGYRELFRSSYVLNQIDQ